jgi:anti-sigma B factor antagonist
VPSDREPVQTEIRTERPVEGVTVVGLVGEHDLASKEDISAAIEQALAAGDGVAVDLSEAEFIDSSTLHVLVSSSRRAAESGRGFAIVIGGNETVLQVFELTGLLTQIAAAGSVPDAIERLRAQASSAKPPHARPSVSES